jgi:hypothetical protein
MFITGVTPKRVTALPIFLPYEDNPEHYLNKQTGDRTAIMTILNDDNSVFRVTGCASFGAHGNSYRICGTNGQIENVRGGGGKVMLRYNGWQIPEGMEEVNYYMPEWPEDKKALIEKAGHGGGDFFVAREFLSCIREGRRPVFDVYFATAMASAAILSHRSILEGGKPYDIPDFRREEDRRAYENDTLSPFHGSDGTLPTITPSAMPEYHTLTEAGRARYDSLVKAYREAHQN